MAVDTAAYTSDLTVSFLKHSSGILDKTSARDGKSSLCGNVSALPFMPLFGRSSNPEPEIAMAPRRCVAPRASGETASDALVTRTNA